MPEHCTTAPRPPTPLLWDGAADTVFVNGRILTLANHGGAPSAVAVKDGRVILVGSDEDARGVTSRRTNIVDLRGKTLMPGANDAHLHLAWWALGRPPYAVDLSPERVKDVASLRASLAAAGGLASGGLWLRGGGWDEARIREFREDGGRPLRTLIDEVTAGRPAALEHRSRHALLLNSAGLSLLGIDRDSQDPAGGTIVRDGAGEPTGLLLEVAALDAIARLPELDRPARHQAIVDAMQELARRGVTSVTDPMAGPDLVRDYSMLHQASRLPLRLSLLLHWPGSSVEELSQAVKYVGLTSGFGDERLRVSGVKLFADGVPSLGTAWMSGPDSLGRNGRLTVRGDSDKERAAEATEMIRLLHARRLRGGIHVLGDRACDVVADAIVSAQRDDPWPAGRHVLIHAGFLSSAAAARLAAAGAMACTNSLVKWAVADSLREVLGEKLAGYHMPVKTLLAAGLPVADTSDAPVAEPQWLQGVACLVTRKSRQGGAVSGPDERVDVLSALRSWTVEGARHDGLEHVKGSIAPGHLADFVVLSDDPTAVPVDEISTLQPLLTVVGGEVVHDGGIR